MDETVDSSIRRKAGFYGECLLRWDGEADGLRDHSMGRGTVPLCGRGVRWAGQKKRDRLTVLLSLNIESILLYKGGLAGNEIQIEPARCRDRRKRNDAIRTAAAFRMSRGLIRQGTGRADPRGESQC